MAHPLDDLRRGIATPSPDPTPTRRRASLLTEERRRTLLLARREFLGDERRSLDECARIARIPSSAIAFWLSQGRTEVSSHWAVCTERGEDFLEDEISDVARFTLDWDQTSGLAELEHLRTLREHGQDPRYWQALGWLLERRMPEKYARRDPPPVPVQRTVIVTVLEKDGVEWLNGAIPTAFAPEPTAAESGMDLVPVEDGDAY
jgi:hypothetical protein